MPIVLAELGVIHVTKASPLQAGAFTLRAPPPGKGFLPLAGSTFCLGFLATLGLVNLVLGCPLVGWLASGCSLRFGLCLSLSLGSLGLGVDFGNFCSLLLLLGFRGRLLADSSHLGRNLWGTVLLVLLCALGPGGVVTGASLAKWAGALSATTRAAGFLKTGFGAAFRLLASPFWEHLPRPASQTAACGPAAPAIASMYENQKFHSGHSLNKPYIYIYVP